MIIERLGCGGCMMSDGRFAVLGDMDDASGSCEALGGIAIVDELCPPLPPMHDSWYGFACAAVARCSIIVAGGLGRKTVELYDEVLGRWLRLPHDLP
jgi:hypothetical protein